MDPKLACDRIATAQHGLVSREQAFAAGLTRREIDKRVLSGAWKRVYRGIYLTLPFPRSWHQILMAAVLHGGSSALASHRAAGSLWKIDGIGTAPVEISVKTGLRIPGAVVHRRRSLDDPEVVVIQGIPTTGVERTLSDLAAVVPAHPLARAIDDALRHGHVTVDSVRKELPRTGRAGRGVLRRLLNERDELDASVESALESRLLRLLRRQGLPPPTTQYTVIDEGVPVARLDFAYPAYRLGIEADGYEWHSRAERWREDLRRQNRLKLMGWTLLHFSWADVRDHPEVVTSQIRTALEQGSPRLLPDR